MDDRISDLLEIVREEIAVYGNLLEHTRQKTALLVQGRVEAILASNRAEEGFTIRLRALEMKLMSLCQDLGRSFRIPREEITLAKLAKSLEQPLALELQTQTALFQNLVKQVKSVSQRNRKLLQKSIQHSRDLLGIISNATGSYQQTGLFEAMPSIQPTFSQRA